MPADFEWKPSSAFSYIDHLLARLRVSEALSVWNDILRKTRSGLSDLRLAAKPRGAVGFRFGKSIMEWLLRARDFAGRL